MEQGFPNHRENSNRFEHALTYEYNGQRKEVALILLPGSRKVVGVATFEMGAEEPVAMMEFALEELRVRYDFFSRLKAAGLF